MNSLLPNAKFQVTETLYDAQSMRDEVNFYAQGQGTPSELTRTITHVLGNYKKKYPISQLTLGGVGLGMGQNSAEELDDVQFTYPVMGAMTKANVVYSTEYTDSDTPGIGGGFFFATFPDNWIKRYYVIQSELGVQAYVHEDPVPVASGGFRYKLQLHAGGQDDYCPPSELAQGKKWVELFTQVAESESRSTESKMVMPGRFKNQMGFMRAGMSWAGNAANKVMKIIMEVNGKKSDVWMDYFMWQFEEAWMEECEHYYWYSRYNRRADGTVPLKDLLTGKVIPTGSGLLEQILNKDTYSELTYKALVNKVGDALFGQNDTGGMVIDLFGGTGARREMDRIIREEGGQILSGGALAGVADKFITGTSDNLALGGFFTTIYHIDGYTIRFKHNPIYDTGRVAKGSPAHPVSGLPLESYRMTFIDTADVDGGPNIRHVAQKGRAYMDGIVGGLTNLPKSLAILGGNGGLQQSKFLSTTQDKSEYTRMKSGGIQLMRGNRCFDLQCVAGQ